MKDATPAGWFFGAATLLWVAATGPSQAQHGALWDTCQKGRIEERIKACTSLIGSKQSPQNLSIAYYHRGDAYFLSRDNDRAAADLTQAIKLNAKFARAYSLRSLVHVNRGDYTAAIADTRTLIKLEPKNIEHQEALGYTYFFKGDFGYAADELVPVLERVDRPQPMLFRYIARARRGQSAAAELQANATRLSSRVWPYAAIEFFLERRTAEALLDSLPEFAIPSRCAAHFYIAQWHLIRRETQLAKSQLGEALKYDICEAEWPEPQAAQAELRRLK